MQIKDGTHRQQMYAGQLDVGVVSKAVFKNTQNWRVLSKDTLQQNRKTVLPFVGNILTEVETSLLIFCCEIVQNESRNEKLR